MKITNSKDVYVAWTNTDLTEGRGRQIPLAVCKVMATAIRLGHKGSVMGTDCDITKEKAFEIDGKWVGPTRILPSTLEDDKVQVVANAKSEAIAKAKSLGMTEEEIAALLK